MNSDRQTVLLRLHDKLVGLLEKLPGGLQKPILRELRPIRDLFLEQRPPRLALFGNDATSVPALLAAMGISGFHTGNATSGWREYTTSTGAAIFILDARNDAPTLHLETGLALHRPDLALVVEESATPPANWKTTLHRLATTDATVLGFCPQSGFQSRLEEFLRSDPSLSARTVASITVSDPAAPEILCAALPACAQLEFARFTNARRAQALIASSLLKSFSGLCGVLGMQPIPLADLPVLLTLQSLMVGLIIHTTGRPVNARLITEFLGALGLGAAAGFAFREIARIAIKIVPFWGHAVSGLIAGAGTYAIGKAAIAYFIDDAPLAETRRLFRKMLRNRNP
jgi:uncharacterized protein (DUF697 family)